MSLFQIFYEKFSAIKTMSGQKTSILSKPHYKKSIGRPFSDFSLKVTSLMHIFCPKNVHYLKTHWSPHILSKKRQFSKNILCSHIIFLKFFHEKPPEMSYPYLVQKASILSKLQYIMGQRGQKNSLFFRPLTKKLLLWCQYFVKKTSTF